MTVRTRFAPSPTGYLHLGGLRLPVGLEILLRAGGPGSVAVLIALPLRLLPDALGLRAGLRRRP